MTGRGPQGGRPNQNDIGSADVLFATKTGDARPASGIPPRLVRHANVGIALAPRICLNKRVRSKETVFLG
jgi:hypothetical protein